MTTTPQAQGSAAADRTAKPKLMTADELLDMPDDGYRYELVRGELTSMPPPGNVHGILAHAISLSLGVHVRDNDLGLVYAAETGFLLKTDPDTVRAPDAAFTGWERLDQVGEVEGYWPGAPDLVVEVISPSDRYSDVEEKIADWIRSGTRMVVVVDYRRRNVQVRQSLTDRLILTEEDILDGGDVVPGWTLAVQEIFDQGRRTRQTRRHPPSDQEE